MNTGLKITNNGSIRRMFEAGAHFAYSKARRHPTAQPYIFGVKDKVEIFDLEKTDALLNEALEFVGVLAKEGKQILFVAGKNEARETIKSIALSLDMPYVAGRWIGGTLTNFDEIKKRITRLEALIDEREKGEFARKYTKREQVLLGREIASLESAFGGLVSMKELPAALFVIDTKREHIPVEEAKKRNIPVVALMNSDCDAESADYPIFANDAGTRSINFFTHALADAYRQHKTILRSAEEKEMKVGIEE